MMFVIRFLIILICSILGQKINDSYFSGLITGFIIDGLLEVVEIINDSLNTELDVEEDEIEYSPEIESLKTEIKNLKLDKEQLNKNIKDLNQDLEVAEDKVKLSNRAIQMAEDKFQALNKDYTKLEHENNRIWKLFEDERNRK